MRFHIFTEMMQCMGVRIIDDSFSRECVEGIYLGSVLCGRENAC